MCVVSVFSFCRSSLLTLSSRSDIVEQVHEATVNQYTLHVNDSGCKRASSPDITGTAVAAK